MALTDLTRISTSGIATGTSLSGAILHGDAHFRGTNVGINSAIFDSSENQLNFKDNVQLTFGNATNGDLRLYHDGSHSHIFDNGTGDLRVTTNGGKIDFQKIGGEVLARFYTDGANELYHNGSKKFQTTQSGSIVTGILTATGFSGPLSNPSGISTFYDLRVTNNLTVEGSTTTLDTNLIGVDRVEVGANSKSIVGVAVTQSGTADIVRLFDGASQVVTVDDQGNVGLGSAIPAQKLDIAGHIKLDNGPMLSDGGDAALKINSDGGYLDIGAKNSNFCHLLTNVPAFFIGRKMVVSAAGGGDANISAWAQDLVLATNNNTAPYAANERMRLKTNGRVEIPVGPLLIGTTTGGYGEGDDLTIATSGHTGITIRGGTSSDCNIYFADGTSGNDQHQGIIQYRHSLNALRFFTNASERLRIDSSGRVLIGTTSATSLADELVVATSGDCGITIMSGTTHNGRLYFSDSGQEGDGFVDYDHQFGNLKLGTRDTTRFTIDSSGRTLLGTGTVGDSTADDLTIETSGSTGITLRSDAGYAGNIAFSDGTSGADQYRGLIQYHHNGDSMRFFTNAAERLRIHSNGYMSLGNTSAPTKFGIRGNSGTTDATMQIVGNGVSTLLLGQDSDGGVIRGQGGQSVLKFKTGGGGDTAAASGGTEVFRLRGSNFLIGTTASRAIASTHTSRFQIEGTGTDTSSAHIIFNSNSQTGAFLFLGKSRGTSNASNALAANGDQLGTISFHGADGTDIQSEGAYIRAQVDGTSGSNDMPGRLVFATTADGSSSATERLRIDSSGNISINNPGTPSTTNGQVGKRLGIKSTQNNVIIGETTNSGNVGLILESRVTGRSGNARSSQIELANGIMRFYTAPSNADVTERLRITSDGNIAINGAAPNHDASSGSIFIKAPSGNPNRGIKWSDTSDTHYVKYESSVIDGLTINGYSGVAFATGSRTNSTWAERLRINSSGRVGINTTTDSMDGVTGNLNIANTNFNNHTVINLSRNTAADRAYIRFSNTNGNIASIGCFASDFVIYAANDLILGPSNTEKLRITSTGLLLGGSDASNNTTLGGNAGDSIASGGISNTLIGKDAGTAITTGDSNTALGYLALKTMSTSAGCVAVGSNALEVCTGADNCAVGFAAGQQLAGGTNNCLFGSSAGLMIQEGDHNIAIGRDALRMGSSGNVNYNVVAGNYSLNQLTNAYNNVVIGYNCSGSATMTGSGTWHSNVVIGYQAGNIKPTTASNIVIGKYTASETGISLSDNIIMGTNAGKYLGNSSNNLIAIGQEAGYKAGYTSSSNHGQAWTHSVAIGYRAMYNATGAPDSVVAIGSNALKEHDGDGDNTSGGYIVSVGNNSMAANQHIRHTVAVGNDAAAYWNPAKGNQHEGGCVFIGGGAGRYQGTAAAIIAIGRDSLNASSATPASGTNNTAIGARCLEKVSTGSHNVAVSALYGALFVSTGSWNTFMGSLAGYAYDTNNCCKTGNYCTQIGAYTRSSGSSNDYENVFGYGGVGKGARTFYVNNDNGVYHGGNISSWSTTSDRRIKKNIINNNTGLDVINSIQVRNFEYKTKGEIINDNPELKNVAESAVVEKEGLQLGVIAQELEKVLPDCVKTQSTGIKTVDSDNITWYLINAVKELSAEVKSLKAQLNS